MCVATGIALVTTFIRSIELYSGAGMIMDFLWWAGIFLAVFVWPVTYARFWGLEEGDEQATDAFLRWGNFTLLLILLLGTPFNSSVSPATNGVEVVTFWVRLLAVLVIWGWIEIVARMFVKYGLIKVAEQSLLADKLYAYLTDNPDNLYYSRYVPHPFLQFTGPRTILPGPPVDALLGFKAIRISDRPKPPGVVRIVCMGGSTTEDGYPEMLQQILDKAVGAKKFQVLNFGMTWWSSMHSVVNFVLNVRDYAPDYVVVHENCNDHHYRGYPLFRGDGAHAYRVFAVPHGMDEALYRFSLLYRGIKIAGFWRFPSVFRPRLQIKDIGLFSGKTFDYQSEELLLFRRNLETMCTLAKADGITLLLATMPISRTRSFGPAHESAYRPHNQAANRIIKEVSAVHHACLVDFAAQMEGHEDYFRDAVHCTPEGNLKKASEVAALILREKHVV